jgi:hypothetical protein
MRTIPTVPTMGAVHTHTDEDNSPTGPTMGAVHVEQYTHTVQHYVTVQMRTILLLDQQWEQYTHTVQHYVAVQMRTIPTGPTMGAVHVEQYKHTVQHYLAVQMRTMLLLDQQWEQYM